MSLYELGNAYLMTAEKERKKERKKESKKNTLFSFVFFFQSLGKPFNSQCEIKKKQKKHLSCFLIETFKTSKR